jgi:hypothetical protein
MLSCPGRAERLVPCCLYTRPSSASTLGLFSTGPCWIAHCLRANSFGLIEREGLFNKRISLCRLKLIRSPKHFRVDDRRCRFSASAGPWRASSDVKDEGNTHVQRCVGLHVCKLQRYCASICEHNRRRSRCKGCGATSICEHYRRRSTCKDCGGTSICEHNRRRSRCRDCGGASICEHNRRRSMCKDCGGASICEHN